MISRSSFAFEKIMGMVPENVESNTLVLSNNDGFKPLVEFHNTILRNLPEKVKVIIFTQRGSFYYNSFPNLLKQKRLEVIDVSIGSNWARDFLPEVVLQNDGNKKLVQFMYEYGNVGEYTSENSGEALKEYFKIPLIKSELYLDGGNLLVDDNQNLFVTEEVFRANNNRYQFSREQIEEKLKEVLNIKKVHWLPILPYEKTHHVDIFMKYMGKNTMIVADSRNPERKKVLDQVAAKVSKDYKILRIMNAEESDNKGWTLTYTNSLILKDRVYVPKYAMDGDSYTAEYSKFDKQAIKIYESLGYKVIGIQMFEMLYYEGAIHCLAKQIAL